MISKVSNKRGSAIVMVMVAVFVLSIIGVGLFTMGVQGRIRAVRTAEGIEARCAADAGLTKAIYEMNQQLINKKWSDSSMPSATGQALPNSSATVNYKVVQDDDGDYIVTSVGNRGQTVKIVYATTGLQGLFEYAILAKETLVLKNDTLVDGYNSQDLSITDVDLEIALISILLGQMILNNGVTVDGEVLVGVDGDPDVVIIDRGATTGDRSDMKEEPPFPEIIPPVLADKGSGISFKDTSLTIGPADSGRYGGIRLTSSKIPTVLTIAGGDVVLHVTGDIWLGNSCEMLINADSSLTLYVDGDITCGNSGGIGYLGPPEEPIHLLVYATGEDEQLLDLKAKSHWSGVVYAPDDEIIIRAKGNVYGAFVAGDFEFKAGGDIYYDEALRDVSIYDEGVRFVVERWSER